MFLGRCGQERGAVTRSDGSASGTGRVELESTLSFGQEGFCYLGKAVWD